jgi:ElaB/YqjD/DUF883 family membrane-anchored ribosome-binding protein
MTEFARLALDESLSDNRAKLEASDNPFDHTLAELLEAIEMRERILRRFGWLKAAVALAVGLVVGWAVGQ